MADTPINAPVLGPMPAENGTVDNIAIALWTSFDKGPVLDGGIVSSSPAGPPPVMVTAGQIWPRGNVGF